MLLNPQIVTDGESRQFCPFLYQSVGKCDNISRAKTYDQVVFSKYLRKESTDTKNDDTKDRTYKHTYNEDESKNNADGTKQVRISTSKPTYYDVLKNGIEKPILIKLF